MTTAPKHAQRSANQPDTPDARNDVAEPTTKSGRETRPLPAIEADLSGDSHEAPMATRADLGKTTAPEAPAPDATTGPDADTTAPHVAVPADGSTSAGAISGSTAKLPTVSRVDADAISDEFAGEIPDEFADEIPDESDGWAAADQPTVVLSPRGPRQRLASHPRARSRRPTLAPGRCLRLHRHLRA
jgi:hypothetical protein